MKSNNYVKLFLGLACVSVLLVTSCKKDLPAGTYAPASSAQDKETLKEASSSLGDAAGEIIASPGAGAVASFGTSVSKLSLGKKDGFLRTQLTNRFMAVFSASKRVATTRSTTNKTNATGTTTSPDASFPSVSLDYDSHTGTYTYDPTGGDDGKGGFNYSKGGSKIIVNFPGDSAKPYNNNATLTISNFQEVQVADSLFLPSSVNADIKVDGQPMARLTYSASYDPSGLPTELSLVLWVKPFTLTILLNNQASVSKGSLALVEDGKSDPIIAFGATVTFDSPARNSVNSVTEAYIQVKRLRIEGDVNVAALGDAPTGAQLTDNVNISVIVDGSKVGKLVFDDVDKAAYIEFNDGTRDPISTYVDAITAFGSDQK